jgi:hypothetical protein
MLRDQFSGENQAALSKSATNAKRRLEAAFGNTKEESGFREALIKSLLRVVFPQGLKPNVYFVAFAARLKSCPDTIQT